MFLRFTQSRLYGEIKYLLMVSCHPEASSKWCSGSAASIPRKSKQEIDTSLIRSTAICGDKRRIPLEEEGVEAGAVGGSEGRNLNLQLPKSTLHTGNLEVPPLPM